MLLLATLCMVGCQGVSNPIVMPTDQPVMSASSNSQDSELPRALLGYYRIHVSADRTQIEIEPVRNATWHLNALAIMEAFDPNSVQIGNSIILPDDNLSLIHI